MSKLLNSIIGGIFILLLFGCSSSSKFKQSVYKKTDSTGVSNTHTKETSFSGSLTSSDNKRVYENTIDIEFESTDTAGIDIISPEDAGGKVHRVAIAGNEIVSSRAIKSISVKLSGNTTAIDITQLVRKDSIEVSRTQSVSKSIEEKSKVKTVKRSGANLLIWLCIAAGICAVVWTGWRFGLFRTRRNNDTTNKITS